MNIINLLKTAVQQQASDIFIVAGRCLSYTKNGQIMVVEDTPLTPVDTNTILNDIYRLAWNRDINLLHQNGDDDFSFAIPGVSRFRVSAYKQRSSFAAVIRVIYFELPDPQQLHIPQVILNLTQNKKGMVLVTGTAGCGKSTTLACMIDHLNKTQNYHIITMEDPIEFLHSHNQSIVSQRELNTDVKDYLTGLRAALRQRPNVILLGELRDYETMEVALTAAETGHLILSSLHTVGAANTIERILDVFPPMQQRQVGIQLATVLQAVVSQQLLPGIDGGLFPAFEIMVMNPAIKTLIRDSKVHQIDNVIFSAQSEGMLPMDVSIYHLYKEGKISDKTAMIYATNPEWMAKKIKN